MRSRRWAVPAPHLPAKSGPIEYLGNGLSVASKLAAKRADLVVAATRGARFDRDRHASRDVDDPTVVRSMNPRAAHGRPRLANQRARADVGVAERDRHVLHG